MSRWVYRSTCCAVLSPAYGSPAQAVRVSAVALLLAPREQHVLDLGVGLAQQLRELRVRPAVRHRGLGRDAAAHDVQRVVEPEDDPVVPVLRGAREDRRRQVGQQRGEDRPGLVAAVGVTARVRALAGQAAVRAVLRLVDGAAVPGEAEPHVRPQVLVVVLRRVVGVEVLVDAGEQRAGLGQAALLQGFAVQRAEPGAEAVGHRDGGAVRRVHLGPVDLLLRRRVVDAHGDPVVLGAERGARGHLRVGAERGGAEVVETGEQVGEPVGPVPVSGHASEA